MTYHDFTQSPDVVNERVSLQGENAKLRSQINAYRARLNDLRKLVSRCAKIDEWTKQMLYDEIDKALENDSR